MHKNRILILPSKSLSRSFTLIELIVVIIIVGILAALGINQYSTIVEKSRLAEAKIRLGAMRQLAYEYYLNNGSLTGIAVSDVGVTTGCSPSIGYYSYAINPYSATAINLIANRCSSNGKTPNATRTYTFYLSFLPGLDQSSWHCYWTPYDGSACFGLPA